MEERTGMNSSLSKKSFGALIRKFRLKNGYTQQQLALKIGIQTKSISFIERGINYPSPENIFKLAQVLNISLDEYIFGYCKFDPTINNDEINSMFNSLSNEDLHFMITMLKTIYGLLNERKHVVKNTGNKI